MADDHGHGHGMSARAVQTQRLMWIAAYIGCAVTLFFRVGLDIKNQPVTEGGHESGKNVLRPKPELYGLRGMYGYAPANTLPSFELAKARWADGISIDVWSSGDGVPMAIEDPYLPNSSNGHGYVWEKTSEYLLELDVGSKFSKQYKGTRMLTFEDVCYWARQNDLTLFVEIRISGKEFPDTQRFVGRLLGIITDYGYTYKTRLSTTDPKIVAMIKRVSPAFSVGLQVNTLGPETDVVTPTATSTPTATATATATPTAAPTATKTPTPTASAAANSTVATKTPTPAATATATATKTPAATTAAATPTATPKRLTHFVPLSGGGSAAPASESSHGAPAASNRTQSVYARGSWDFVSMHYSLLSADIIEDLRAVSKGIFVYRMPDDVDGIIRFLRLGADGLVTRYVSEVQQGWYKVSTEGVQVFQREQ